MEPVSLESGWDLSRPADRRKLYDTVAREKPDLIVAAWPCSPFSQLQNLQKDKDAVLAKQLAGIPFVRVSAHLADMQLAGGRHFLGENPLRSRAWATAPGRHMLERLWAAGTDMCAHGLREPEYGMPAKKATQLVVTTERVAQRLGRRC